MTITVEQFIPEKHYEGICSWWKEHNWPIIPLTHLSYLGFVSVINGTPAAAAWLYQTDSAFCLLEWMVVNPKIRRQARTTAISAVIQEVKIAAEHMGFKTIFMNSKSGPLIRRLEAHGFSAAEHGMINLVLDLNGGKNGR